MQADLSARQILGSGATQDDTDFIGSTVITQQARVTATVDRILRDPTASSGDVPALREAIARRDLAEEAFFTATGRNGDQELEQTRSRRSIAEELLMELLLVQSATDEKSCAGHLTTLTIRYVPACTRLRR